MADVDITECANLLAVKVDLDASPDTETNFSIVLSNEEVVVA